MSKKKVTLSVDSKIYSDFQKYCEENAIMLSKKIEIVMKNILNSKKKNILLVFWTFAFLILMLQFAFASSFIDKTSADFNNGTYNWTFYNSSGFVQLNNSYLNGAYTSRILDAGNIARWNNLSWEFNISNATFLYAVDAQGAIYSSSNSGVSWTLKNSSYGRTSSTQGIFSDNFGNLYIIVTGSNKEVWKSINNGVTWSVVNDTFSGNNYLYAGSSDSNNNLYVIAGGAGTVYKSGNLGVSWTQVNGSYNGGNGNVAGLTRNLSDGLYAVDAQGAIYSSSNSGVSWTLKNSSYGRTSSTQGIFSDNFGNLYIIVTGSNKEVWKSTNNGITWSVVNDTFSNLGLLTGISDNNGYLYAIAGTSAGIVYRSSNGGVSWTQINASYNGGNGAAKGMALVLKQGNLTIQIRNCSLADCSDGIFVNVDLSNINLTGRYFQYRVNFSREDSSLNPRLYNVSIDYDILDNTPPSFSNYNENPINNSAYSANGIYKFNISVIENKVIDKVGVEFNGINYTNWNITNISNIYMFNRTNLAVGTYYYRWWANDSYGNFNSSELRYYTISKGDNTLTLTSSVGWAGITYGTSATFSCSAVYGSPKLYINNIEVVSPKTIILGAGSHNIKCNISESQNYSSGISQGTLTVNKASPVLIFLANSGTSNLSLIYPQQVNVTAIANFGTVGLDKDSVNYLSYNSLNISLSAGSYLFRANVSGNQNYSDVSYAYYNITVNKSSSQTSLSFDKNSPQNYSTLITPTCSLISGVGSPVLTMNGNVINSGVALNLGAGNYNFNCSLASSQNYSSSENVSSFTINQVSTTTTLITTPASPVTYGNVSNFSCSNSAGLATILYINGVDKTSEKGLAIIRGAGSYVVNCTFSGNQNYSASSSQENYIINKASGNVKLYLNGNENNLIIDYPEQYNITATTLYDSVIVYMDGADITSNNGKNITPTRNSGYYNITAISLGDENHSSLGLTRWLNVTLDNISPTIDLISPQEGGSYGYNVSLPLEFYASDEHLDSCWYNINNNANITLANCQNTTFNVSNDGIYTLYLYANDSLGNMGVKNSSFSVLVGSPTIILNSPIGIYLNTQNITFIYTPNDLDLRTCELWGDFTGTFALNQTNSNPTNNAENTFNLNLPDGSYKWNIRCNDSMGNFAFNGNKSFYVDTNAPVISISEPKGTKESWLGIPLVFTVNDSSPVSCKYSVSWSTGGIVIFNTSIINCSSIIFNLSSVGDYVFNLFVSDLASNFNSVSSGFTVSTSNPVIPPSGGSSSGSGGGGSSSSSIIIQKGELEISDIGNIVVHEGDKKSLSLNAKNIGKIFLNNCRLIFISDINSWFYSNQIVGIAPGENKNFIFDLNVPEGIEQKDYSGEVELKCDEISQASSFIVGIPKNSAGIEIKEIKQEKTNLKINYIINSEIETSIDIWLVDKDGQEIKRIKDNGKGESSVVMEFDEGLVGVYSIYFAPSSDLNNFVKQSVVLGKSSTTGFAILDQPGNKMIGYIVFVLIICVAVFFIVRSRNSEIHESKHRTLFSRKEF